VGAVKGWADSIGGLVGLLTTLWRECCLPIRVYICGEPAKAAVRLGIQTADIELGISERNEHSRQIHLQSMLRMSAR